MDEVKIHLPAKGYFVEAGAHDGVGDSQTYALELSGWEGLCVEPSAAFTGLQKSRRCHLDHRALWIRDEPVAFCELPGNKVELSGIPSCFRDAWDRQEGVTRLVEGVTLTTLLRVHGAPERIDYLVLDTEGSEVDILRAHDHRQYRFGVAMIEHNGVEGYRQDLQRLMEAHGYERMGGDGTNDFYRDRQ